MSARSKAHSRKIENERLILHAGLIGNLSIVFIAYAVIYPFLDSDGFENVRLSPGALIVGIGFWWAASGFLGRLKEEG